MKLLILGCLIASSFFMGISVAYGSAAGYILNMLAAGFNGALILRALNRGEELEAEYAKKENF